MRHFSRGHIFRSEPYANVKEERRKGKGIKKVKTNRNARQKDCGDGREGSRFFALTGPGWKGGRVGGASLGA